MRKSVLVTLLLMLLLLLAACGGASTPEPEPTEAPAVEPTEAPAAEPTEEPAAEPTEAPAAEPTEAPEETTDAEAEKGEFKTACLVTDLGNVNDGTFNEFAYTGMVDAAEAFGLETTFIETQSETDYAKNIDTCVQEGYDAVITVGFLIADATLAAAEANADTMFIGVDQFFAEPPANLVGIQYREDQGGFLAGALACMMTESDVVGGVYGVDIPPVIKFRNGFENGCAYVNPDASALGVYVPSFVDPAAGASTAEQFIGEGADVIFGAGGPTGSGGIRNAAEQGIYAIGVDQDEYHTTFGGGDAPGADKLISSAMKRVDLGVYDQLQGLSDPDSGLWAGGGLYILEAANNGITYAPFHDAEGDIPDAVKTRLEEIRQMLANGELETGVDPISGDMMADTMPEPVPFDGTATSDSSDSDDSGDSMGGLTRACLVTDLGNVNDGTFNEFAYNGMVKAEEEFGFETTFIETQSETDYAKNIDTCVQEGYEAVVTVGFLIADATLAAAEANPDTMFIGVDQFFAEPPANLVGIQYREDQGGFLAGALACMMTESGVVGGVYGVDIPPVVKFRNGFENGCGYVNPDASALGVYVPSFVDPAAGASTAEQFIGEGADVIFGAGGPTGSGGIRNAAEQGIYVIGVDQDEYNTTFGGGDAPGADKLISSAVKRVDLGVYDQLKGLVDSSSGLWSGGGLYILEAANDGITYADFHDAAGDIPDAVKARLEEIRQMLASGDLDTGVDPISGDVLEDQIPEPVPFDGEASAEASDDGSAMAESALTKACLVTDLGNVNDGTFNEFAYNGLVKAEEEFGFETTFIETQSETDYAKNIDTCVQEGYEAVVTVGFLIADATLAAAEANPDTMFVGVDQFFAEPPANLVGIQYREDQGGFLAGALACMMTESGVVGGVYGVDIPPVVKFRNGFENGCGYVNPDASALGVYVPSFVDPAAGASTAEQFIGEGADVIFGAGGPTGSGGIRNGAEQGIYVIGVDQDEYNTTFGGGDAPGADKLISSAVKRVDLGVYDQLKGLADPNSELWAGGGLYILEAANNGITYADFHDAEGDIPDSVKTRLEEIRQALADGELDTGVDPISGDVLADQIPEPVPFEK